MNKPSIENIDQWLFESVEGNLTPQQEQLLEEFLVENPAYLEEQTLWGESILEPADDEERYPREKSLLKRALWERPIFYISTAAATLVGAAIWVFSSIGSHNDAPQTKSVSSTEKVSQDEVQNSAETANENETIAYSEKVEQPENKIEEAEKGRTEEGTDRKKTLFPITNPKANRLVVSEGSAEIKIEKSETIARTESTEKVESSTESVSINTKKETISKEVMVEAEQNSSKLTLNETNTAQGAMIQESVNSNPLVQDLVAETFEVDRLKRNPMSTLVNNRFEEEKVVALSVAKPQQVRTSVSYDKSFSATMKSFARKVEKMMDNPLALYNSKDQYFHAPNMQTLDANFAAVGDKMGPRIIGKSRAQYYGNINQQFNSSLSFDTYVRSLRGGLGVQLDHTYYGNGQINIGQVALTYSPKIGISRNWTLEPALRVKVGNKSLAHSKLNQGDLIELQRGAVRTFSLNPDQSSSNDLWYKDVGVGMMTNSKWFYAGVQVDNLGKHFNNIYSLAETGANTRAGLHFIANVGTDYVSRNKNISLSPYVIYQKMEKLSEIWGGAIFRYKKLTLGGAYSSAGGYAGSIGLKTNSFMLTYNADVTTSALLDKQVLSHQLILRILINNGSNGQRMLKQL